MEAGLIFYLGLYICGVYETRLEVAFAGCYRTMLTTYTKPTNHLLNIAYSYILIKLLYSKLDYISALCFLVYYPLVAYRSVIYLLIAYLLIASLLMAYFLFA